VIDMSHQTTVVITKEGKWYVARSAELGVASQGRSVDEARQNLKEALELFLEDQPEAKEILPTEESASLVTTLTV
jgi:predicted RNase H-like HicB family nuclease